MVRNKEIAQTDFQRKLTQYCAEFATEHLNSFRPHAEIGKTLGKSPEVWRNVSEHCLVAGMYGQLFVEAAVKKGLISLEEGEVVVSALVLHDYDKPHEVEAQKNAESDQTLTVQTLENVRVKSKQNLHKMGISKEILDLIDSNVPENEKGPQTLAQDFLWYIDAMLSGTRAVPIAQRFDDLERGWDGTKEDPDRAARNRRFSELYTSRYGGKSLYQVQREIGERLSPILAELFDDFSGDPEDLPKYLENELIIRVLSSTQ